MASSGFGLCTGVLGQLTLVQKRLTCRDSGSALVVAALDALAWLFQMLFIVGHMLSNRYVHNIFACFLQN